MTWLERLNQFSPKRCRFVARRSHSQIAQLSGLARSTVVKISHLPVWDKVPAQTIQRFTAACGIDMARPQTGFYRKLKRMKRYIAQATPAERKMMGRLLA